MRGFDLDDVPGSARRTVRDDVTDPQVAQQRGIEVRQTRPVLGEQPIDPLGCVVTAQMPAHLRQPPPHLVGWCLDGDRVVGAHLWSGNQLVTRQACATLGRRGTRLSTEDLQRAVADGGYQGKATADAVEAEAGIPLEIVKRSDTAKGFYVLPKRWIVERTFGWLGRCRRLAKDFENLSRSHAAFIILAMIRIMMRRIVRLRHG
mgnify:CR=1 FL=1